MGCTPKATLYREGRENGKVEKNERREAVEVQPQPHSSVSCPVLRAAGCQPNRRGATLVRRLCGPTDPLAKPPPNNRHRRPLPSPLTPIFPHTPCSPQETASHGRILTPKHARYRPTLGPLLSHQPCESTPYIVHLAASGSPYRA